MFNTVSKVLTHNEDTALFLVDIGVAGFKDILEEFPNRVINFGICEDGMVSVMAGLALKGIIPICYGISPFIVGRAFEQLKLDFGYQNLGGNFITTGASYDFSKLGYSHYCPEDLGIIQMIPNFQFIAPSTGDEFRELFTQTYDNGQPTYFRLSDYVNQYKCSVKFGEATVIKKGTKATVIAVSTMLDSVIGACGDEDVTILYYTTLMPFDEVTLKDNCPSSKVLICEPHFTGVLAYNVINALSPNSIRIKHLGLPREIFRNYGTKAEKDEFYGLNAMNIKFKLNHLLQS
jgi:transketolase